MLSKGTTTKKHWAHLVCWPKSWPWTLLVKLQFELYNWDYMLRITYRLRFLIKLGIKPCTYASIGNRHFCTVSCDFQTYLNYKQSSAKLGTLLENKVLWKSKFSQNVIFKSWFPSLIFFTEKNQKDSVEFRCWKMTLKVWIYQSLRRFLIILAGDMI